MKDTYISARLVAADCIRFVSLSDINYLNQSFILLIDRKERQKLFPSKTAFTPSHSFIEFKLAKPLELGHSYFLFLPGILVLCQTVHLLCCFFHEARCQSKWCLRLERAAQKFVDSGVFLLCFRYRFLHLLRLNVPLILLRLQLQELIQMIFSIQLLQIPLAARNYFC